MKQKSTARIIREVRDLIAQAKVLNKQAYSEFRFYVVEDTLSYHQSGPSVNVQSIPEITPYEKYYILEVALPTTNETFFEEVVPARMKEMISEYSLFVQNHLNQDIQPVREVLEEYQKCDIEGMVDKKYEFELQLCAIDQTALPKSVKSELDRCKKERVLQTMLDYENAVMSLYNSIITKLDILESDLHEEQVEDDVDDE